MKVENIETLKDCEIFLEGVINDFESGLSEKWEVMDNLRSYTNQLIKIFNVVGSITENIKENYQRYGESWKKEIEKLPKKLIIDLFAKAGHDKFGSPEIRITREK